MKKDGEKSLRSFSIKVNKTARIDLHLKEGLFEKSNHVSFINVKHLQRRKPNANTYE